MKRSKKLISLTFVAIFIAILFISSFAAKTYNSACVIVNCPLYSEPDFSSNKVLDCIVANEEIAFADDNAYTDENGVKWQKIKYLNHEGYIPYSNIYFTNKTESYEIQVVKAKINKMGDKVPLYKYYSDAEEPVLAINDGEKINLIVEQHSYYGEFRKVVYEGEFYFIKTENITAGLSYNQLLTVIIVSVFFGIVIITAIIIIVIRAKKVTFK